MREPLPDALVGLAARLHPQGWDVRAERTERGYQYVAEFRGTPPCAEDVSVLPHTSDAFASTIRATSPEEFKRMLEVSAIRLAWHAAGCPQCWDVVQRAQQ